MISDPSVPQPSSSHSRHDTSQSHNASSPSLHNSSHPPSRSSRPVASTTARTSPRASVVSPAPPLSLASALGVDLSSQPLPSASTSSPAPFTVPSLASTMMPRTPQSSLPSIPLSSPFTTSLQPLEPGHLLPPCKSLPHAPAPSNNAPSSSQQNAPEFNFPTAGSGAPDTAAETVSSGTVLDTAIVTATDALLYGATEGQRLEQSENVPGPRQNTTVQDTGVQSTSESAAESAQNENMHSIRYADSSSADCDAASHGTANENASASVDTSPTHAVPEDSGQNNGGQNNNDGNTPANISTVQPVANAFTSAASSRSQPPSTPTPSNEGRGNKRPNQSISHAEKRRLCEISDDNPKANHKDVAFLFHAETGHRVERSTVTRILQRKVFWKNAGTRDCNRKRIASSRFPTIEEALYELVRNKTRFSLLRVRLTDKELVKYSKQIAETMRKHYGSTVKTSTNYGPHLKGFRGSLTWVSSFKKRNAISPPEDVRSFSSGIYGEQSYAAAETLDIWNNELKIEETKELLSNWTRLEDVYFLDATVLATSARPEHACPPGASQQAQDAQAAVDEVLGFIESQGGGRNSTTVDLTGSGPPSSSLNFPLPSVPSAMDVLPEPTITNILSHEQSGVAFHTSDPFTAGTSSSAADQASATPLTETRHSISENSVVTVLFCNNGVGNDRRAPWMIGRKAFRKLGREEGQIWHDCPVRYFHNAQGWLTARLVRKWVEEFDKSVDRSVVILTSLLNACDLELLDLKHVTVVPIPRTELGRVKEGPMLWNCGSASPFHHGVEQMFRAIYRGLVVERALQYIDEGKLIKAMSMQGAARMINEAWEKVPLNVVRKCWRDLGFMPARFQRTYSRPRANSKAMWGQSLDNLSQLLSRYRDAIPDYPLSGVMDLSQSDVDGALTQRCDYLWLDGEQSVFHPMGSVLDFVRSVHVEEVENEVGSDDEMESNRGVQKGWGRIEDHVTALEVVNRLADFMNCDAERDKEHCLYLVGSLQLEIKRLHDLRQNEAHARKWNGSNGKNAS